MFENAIIKVISWNNIPIYDGRKIASILDNCNSFKDVGIFYKTISDFIDNHPHHCLIPYQGSGPW